MIVTFTYWNYTVTFCKTQRTQRRDRRQAVKITEKKLVRVPNPPTRHYTQISLSTNRFDQFGYYEIVDCEKFDDLFIMILYIDSIL